MFANITEKVKLLVQPYLEEAGVDEARNPRAEGETAHVEELFVRPWKLEQIKRSSFFKRSRKRTLALFQGPAL